MASIHQLTDEHVRKMNAVWNDYRSCNDQLAATVEVRLCVQLKCSTAIACCQLQ